MNEHTVRNMSVSLNNYFLFLQIYVQSNYHLNIRQVLLIIRNGRKHPISNPLNLLKDVAFQTSARLRIKTNCRLIFSRLHKIEKGRNICDTNLSESVSKIIRLYYGFPINSVVGLNRKIHQGTNIQKSFLS